MGYPTLSYTITNGTPVDATQPQQNFTDLLNGITDGTKDLNVSAVTLAGTFTCSDIVPASDNAYDLGDSTHYFKDVYVSGETKGDRVTLCAGTAWSASDANQTYYIAVGAKNVGTVAKNGFVATRAGSIVGLSANAACLTYTASDTFTVHAYKNGASVLALSAMTVNANGNFSARTTQARGTDTFVAGDRIEFVVVIGASMNSTGNLMVQMELIFDS